MTYMMDIPIDQNNNCHLFKNNMEYAQAKFIQASKMSKKSMDIFFNNSDLALIQEYLSYKNGDKMGALLRKLSYGKIIQ